MNIKGSWKTSSAGLLMIAGAAVHIYFNRTAIEEKMIMEAVVAVIGGLGLFFARDNNKSSEDVGAK